MRRHERRPAGTTLVLLALLPALAMAAAPAHARRRAPAPPAPIDETICAPGTTIGRIVFERINVFDPAVPGEDKLFFRTVNVLHRPMLSREWMLRRVLTIRPGEPCDPAHLHEAERLLRTLPFLQDASIRASEREGSAVTVVVRARDAWSTSARFSFSSQGGAEKKVFRVQEDNLLGTGTRLTFETRSDQDRRERRFRAETESVLPGRLALELVSSDNSDGREQFFALRRPFRSFDERYYAEAAHGVLDRVDKVYVGADEVDRWRLSQRASWIGAGVGDGGVAAGRVRRLFAGLRQEDRRWETENLRAPARPDLAPRAFDQTLLTLGAEWMRLDFRREQFLNQGGRLEDFDLGTRFNVRLAWAIPGVSNDGGGYVGLSAREGIHLGEGRFLVVEAAQDASRTRGDWFNLITRGEASFWARSDLSRRTLFARATVVIAHELEGTARFLLGADTGLRGYRTRAFSGDRMVLLQVEQRFFTEQEWLHLFNPGYVVFADAGGAWDGRMGLDDLHPDLGVGLRLGLLRSSSGSTIHLNAAVPLDPNGDPGHQGIRFSVLGISRF